MLTEKQAPFTLRYVDLKNKPDWFLALSPRGKVPVLLADGRPLFESSVINEFLDETLPPPLLPADPWQRASQRAWVEVANDLLATQFAVLAAGSAEVDAARAKLEPVLQRFEEAVASGAIDENAFGLVHVAVAPALHRFVVVEQRVGVRFLSKTPRLDALAHVLAARPSVASTVPADFAERFLDVFKARGGALITGAKGTS
jgi:glutathione S-transferase